MNSTITGWKEYLLYHAPWQLGMVLIFISSSLSADDLPDIAFKLSDKLIHFVLFGTLGVLIFRSLEKMPVRNIRAHAFLWSILFTSLYGALDEMHQYFVPGRFTSLADWIADTLGVICLVFLYRKFIHKRIQY